MYWTLRALTGAGFMVVPDSEIVIETTPRILGKFGETEFLSIENLLKSLSEKFE